MLLALNQLEANGIIHGHITIESFFIKDNHLILNDITPFFDIMTDQKYYVCYKSIEELSGIYSPRSDLRRIGIVLYILIFNKNPYPNEKTVFDEANGRYHLNFDGLDDEYTEILKMLLNPINITTTTVLDKLYEIKNRNEKISDDDDDDDDSDDNNKPKRKLVNKHLKVASSSSTENNRIFFSETVIPPNPLEIKPSSKRIGNYIYGDILLGKGGSSEVYIGQLADNNNDRKQYAIKLMDIKEENEEIFMSEAKSLISLDEKISQHVIRFIDAFCENDKYVLVTEYCQLGDLRKELNRRKENNEHYTSDEIVRHFHNLLFSLSEIHKFKIIHRDIKPENIFFAIRDSHRRLLFGDFGLCAVNKEGEMNNGDDVIGTLRYISPEIMRGENYNHLIDCWSLGCVLYEMCTLQYLYDFNYPVSDRNLTKIDPSYPKCISEIIDGMTQIEKEDRMSASDALKLLQKSTPLFN